MSSMILRANSHCRARGGLTLIEVVVGLALLATLLAAALAAGSSHLRQAKAAEEKIAATRILNRFLTEWAANGYRQFPDIQQWEDLDIEGRRIAVNDLGPAGLTYELHRVSVSILEERTGREQTSAEIVVANELTKALWSSGR